ncbi:MAG: hypothetical protein CFE44_07535 [Burkholderiales bacterium PBB4]|nr:MAG: hypothetical protein CFE44_07535 [Burkholderiales bacterium PBB4]
MSSLSPPIDPALRVTVDSHWLRGLLTGLLAASIGALYTVFARWGIERGMDAADMTLLRFGVAGLVTLPVLLLALMHDGQGLLAHWRAWLAVALLAGPLFGLLMFTALQWAPAAHAAVLPFTAMSVMGTLLAATFLGDRLSLRKAGGIAVVVAGLVVLSGLDLRSLGGRALWGDALFLTAGTLWAGFGIVMRRQRIDPLLATAVISFFALITYVPIYLASVGVQRLLSVAPLVLWTEVLVQGVVAGAGTLYTYSKTVALLGPARAAVFPALAPGIAALLAWPVLGHVPTGIEAAGMLIAVSGLLITVTAGRRRQPG